MKKLLKLNMVLMASVMLTLTACSSEEESAEPAVTETPAEETDPSATPAS